MVSDEPPVATPLVRAPLAFAAVGTCAALLAVAALYWSYFSAPKPLPPTTAPDRVILGARLAKRLLIIIHDGVHAAAAQDRQVAPFWTHVASRGVYGTLLVPGPTLSAIGLTAMGTGTTPPLRATLKNFTVPRWGDEDFLSLARLRGPLRVGFFGNETSYELYGRDEDTKPIPKVYTIHGRFVDGLYYRDRQAIRRALAFARSARWDVLILHLDSTDKMAHRHDAWLRDRHSGRSTPYALALKRQDAFARALYSASGPGTTVFIVSDHGVTPGGAHGSFDTVTRKTFYAATGPGLRSGGLRREIVAAALAPIWSRLLGVRGPRVGEAPLPLDFLDLTPRLQAETQQRNLQARTRFLTQRCKTQALGCGFLGASRTALSESRRLQLAGRYAQAAAVLYRAHRELQQAVSAQTAVHQRQRIELVIILGAVLLIGILAWFFVGTGSGWGGLLAAAATLCAIWTLQWARSWVYGPMFLAGDLFDVTPLLLAPVGLTLGMLPGVWGARFGWPLPASVTPRRANVLFLAAAVLSGYLICAWPFGTTLETFALLLFAVIGLLARPTLASERRATGQVILIGGGVAAICVMLLLNRHWLGGSIQRLHRVADHPMLALACGLAITALAGITLWRERSRAVAALALLMLVSYGSAQVARSLADPLLARCAAGLFLLSLTAIWRAQATRESKSYLLLMIFLAGYRLTVVDANQLMGTLFALGMLALFAGLRPVGPRQGVILASMAAFAYWFAQGNGYELSSFDVRVAFLFVDDGLNIGAASAAYLLKHSFAWIAVLTPLSLHARPAAQLPRSLAALFAALIAARCWLTLFFVPLHADSGWIFLRSAHYIAGELINGFIALAMLGLLAVIARLR